MIKASFKTIDITGPIGLKMAGYAEREHGNIGIHDPVSFRIAIIESNNVYFALGVGDYIGVDSHTLKNVREQVSKKTKIPYENIVLCATHTHSSYAATNRNRMMLDENNPLENDYYKQLIQKIIGGFEWAYNTMEEVSIGYGIGECHHLGKNRNNPQGYFDPSVHVIRFTRLDESLLGTIVEFSCHPTVLNYKNYLISADYVGEMRNLVEQVYPNSTCVFVLGAAGEVSTRFTRRGQDFKEIKRLGHLLAAEVIKQINLIKDVKVIEIKSASPSMSFMTKDFGDDKTIQETIDNTQRKLDQLIENNGSQEEIRKEYVNLQGATRAKEMKKTFVENETEAVLQVTKFGPFNFVGIPGEAFGEISRDIKSVIGKNTIVAGYCNDYLGYIVSEEGYQNDGYEKYMTPFEIKTHQKIVEKVVETFNKL